MTTSSSTPVRLLQQFPEVREYYQRKFRYVLIDEYQDTNHLQYLLAALLAGGRKNICVVGDDDQSIYRFRGATIENILSFESEYKNARVIRLEQNYRSTKKASWRRPTRSSATMRAARARSCGRSTRRGTRFTATAAMNEHDEAQFVAAQIRRRLLRGPGLAGSRGALPHERPVQPA